MKIVSAMILFLFALPVCFSQDYFDCARKGDTACFAQAYVLKPEFINLKNEAGFSALVLAVYYEQKSATEWLLTHGADPNLNSPEGTALIAAVYRGNPQLCQLLIDKGAQVDASNVDGVTALMFASQNGDRDCAILLLKQGANKNLKSKAGYTAADYAKMREDQSMMNILR